MRLTGHIAASIAFVFLRRLVSLILKTPVMGLECGSLRVSVFYRAGVKKLLIVRLRRGAPHMVTNLASLLFLRDNSLQVENLLRPGML